MTDREQRIQFFFRKYEEGFNTAVRGEKTDVAAAAQCFASCFVAANPHGVICGKNDDDFLAAIPAGYTYYRNVGITSMNITAMQVMLLDEYHAMAIVQWRSDFIRADHSAGSIPFQVIYFVQDREGVIKIFGYITGDEQAALKAEGLV